MLHSPQKFWEPRHPEMDASDPGAAVIMLAPNVAELLTSLPCRFLTPGDM